MAHIECRKGCNQGLRNCGQGGRNNYINFGCIKGQCKDLGGIAAEWDRNIQKF